MSSFDRRKFLLTGCAAGLAGCGFTPAYGPGGSAAVLRNAVRVDAPDSRDGFQLTRALETRLGRAADARYGLSYSIRTTADPIAISANNVTLRYNLLGNVTYALRDLDDGAVVTSGKAESFTSYSASGSTVATQSAERDARARLMTILAEQIVTRLIAAAPGRPA
ncbi:LPS assembly lipoprotein LptE [Roseovarius sp. SYSU LYC5161]|jgi:LPS-assembly lipoprotein|uniref:LPS assembly lipoprotein LptE n=1 Tax=Roseovarius halophilus (ex Wu et al. 2025) TaxID=3376060 RepID=UPI00287157AD|nr:LPS assembly lipoprotein LptE [Roseovarius sp.]